MLQNKKIITIVLTLVAVTFEIVTLPLVYLLTLIFKKKLRFLNENGRTILLTSLSTYTIFFVLVLTFSTILFYVNHGLAEKYFLDRSYLLTMILYLILLKVVFGLNYENQIEKKSNIYIFSKYTMYLIIAIFALMVFISVNSRELWAKIFDFLKVFAPLFIIPVYGLIKTKDINTKYELLKIIIISYGFFLAINFSLLIGSFIK